MRSLFALLAACASAHPATAPVTAASAPAQALGKDLRPLFEEAVREKNVQKFEQVIAEDPTYCFAYINIGLLQPERAVDMFSRAPCGEGYAALTAHALHQGDVAQAQRYAQEGIARYPQSVALRHRYAEVLIGMGQYANAEAQALGVLKLDETNAQAMLSLSRAYYGQKKYALARLAADNARAIAPERGEIHHQLGVLHLQKNERPQALAAFKKAAELQPALVATQIHLTQLLSEAGDFDGALLAAQTATTYAPESRKAQLALANALRGVQRYGDAAKAYEALGKEPDALYNAGLMYLDAEIPNMPLEERLDKALRTLGQLPGTPEIQGYLLQAKRQLDAEKKRKLRKVK